MDYVVLQALQALYLVSALGLAAIGLNALLLSLIYLRHRGAQPATPHVTELPRLLVQLPIYNEQHVVERLIEAIAAQNYPREQLCVQVLDDSTDETVSIASEAVERAGQMGLRIDHIRRADRSGYKAGALNAGLAFSDADFVAVFDADFAPEPDFLRRIMPYFSADEHLGLVQARWGHLNAASSGLTRAQALALDSHFVVEQTARHRSGLFMNFAGTAGVWRRACIDDCGGWNTDTLSEDIDLSYRAQMRGWRFLYLPELSAPAEIPPLMMAFKRQQSRWATGTVQVLRRQAGAVLRSALTPWQKYQAMVHLGGYLIHPLMIVVLLLSLPLLLMDGLKALPLAGLGIAIVGPPLQAILAQQSLGPGWQKRLFAYPLLMLLGLGIAASNSRAVLRGFRRSPQEFLRTPKFQQSISAMGWAHSAYVLPLDEITWIELLLAVYAGVTAWIAFTHAPGLAFFMLLYSAGNAYVSLSSLVQGFQRTRRGDYTVISTRLPSGSSTTLS